MADQRLRIAVVGMGFGKHIVSEIVSEANSKLLELAAVCDIDRVKADAVAAQYGVKAYYSLEELLADKSIPAIGLFTGPVGRADLIRTILRAGKDIMTTKPFELDADKGLAVLHEARKLGRVVHLNSPSPLPTRDLLQIRQFHDELNLGRPIACRADVWARYREKVTGTWYDDPKLCPVAPIYRLGIYLINDLTTILGEARKVAVVSSRIFTERPTADNGQLGILFKNGAIGNVFASFCVEDGQFYSNTMTINYERGTIYRNMGPTPFHQGNSGKIQAVALSGPQQTVIREAHVTEGSGCYLWETFYRAVRGEKLRDEVTPETIVAGVRIINAMSRSEQSGKIENV